jgi:hypothetical protein
MAEDCLRQGFLEGLLLRIQMLSLNESASGIDPAHV